MIMYPREQNLSNTQVISADENRKEETLMVPKVDKLSPQLPIMANG